MLVHWIWLSTRSMSDRMKAAVLEAFADPEDAYAASREALENLGSLTPEALESLMDKDLSASKKILNRCTDNEISLVTLHDADYPTRLKNIFDPPLVLYYRGKLPTMDDVPVIGAVGTRHASAYGLNVSYRMGYQLASYGAIVVSGAADGIDASAMQGALMAGGTVIAVLGCGVDRIYPKVNKFLFEDLYRSGCVMSEYPPQTRPEKWHFPRRNRIISGLSNGVVVVEAPEGSGSLITAHHALEQCRDVFAVPGNVDMPSFAGSYGLLRDGATPVRDGWDVMSEYQSLYDLRMQPIPEPNVQLQKVAQKPLSPAKKQPPVKKDRKITVDKAAKQPYIVLEDILPTLSQQERALVQLLTEERLVDELIAQSGQSAAQVSATLTVLEIKGVVRRLPGNRVSLM